MCRYCRNAGTEQTGEIELLPALPSAWKSGSFKGLKVRGGGEVSAKWKEGRLAEAGLKALVPGSFRIKLPADSANMGIKINQKAVSLPVVDGTFESRIAGWRSVGTDVLINTAATCI